MEKSHAPDPNAPYLELEFEILDQARYLGKTLLCIDYGTKRIGLAVCDKHWKLASFHSMVLNSSFTDVAQKIKQVANTYKTNLLVIGYPLHMDGYLSPMAQSCVDFAKNLQKDHPEFIVFMQDERLSSNDAENRLSLLGATNKQRKEKVDKIAAEIILTRFLNRANDFLNEHKLEQDGDEIEGILGFWFKELKPQDWFCKSEALDQEIETRFGDLLKKILNGDKKYWLDKAQSCLAYILVSDQFSRNILRGKALIYEQADPLGRYACKIALEKNYLLQLSTQEQKFMVMPLMHSESLDDQNLVAKLLQMDPESFKWALHHRDIIDRFGRFPHRNAILKRESTPDELAYLNSQDAFQG